MKVLVYSERMASHKDVGWHRAGTKIGYYLNGLRRNDKSQRRYFTHTFTYNFEYPNDTVYFAYSYPYTYTDMVEDLNKITNDPAKAQFCSRKVLCETLAGNKCEFLTITSKMN
jgi:cytosolic carboxypeptidase protein 2/3